MLAKSSGKLLGFSALALVALGLVMISSTALWIEDPDQPYRHLSQQSIFAGLGLVAATLLALLDYRWLREWAPWIFAGACVALALCYVPGIGVEANGETRWIKIGGVQIQPSEPAKIALMIGLAAWFARHRASIDTFWRGFVLPAGGAGFLLALILFEKDMGTTAALGLATFCLLFVAGTRFIYLAVSGGIAGFAGYLMVQQSGNRMERIEAWKNLAEHKLGAGLQQFRGLMALQNGGTEGVGLGNGAEKFGYLPFSHTDFIYPIIGEELGLYATLGVILAFVIITVGGVAVSLHANDLFGKLLGFGLTASIVAPAMVNIAVTTAAIPNTGLPLPFVSYGGSSLVFTLAAIGILISIHRRGKFDAPDGSLLRNRSKEPIRL